MLFFEKIRVNLESRANCLAPSPFGFYELAQVESHTTRPASHRRPAESKLAPNLGTNSTFFRIIDEPPLHIKLTVLFGSE
jgi:hypothetical protein